MLVKTILYYYTDDQYNNKYFTPFEGGEELYNVMNNQFKDCKVARNGPGIKMHWREKTPPVKGKPLHVELNIYKKIYQSKLYLNIDVRYDPSVIPPSPE